ncbi:hypothetical protein VUJ49_14295 [Pseudomonas berkeleyensis]|uniref:Uncharacterized protein n=1 Tax=Pseudomonas berkeleyensis TaxID=2726956 RepID=A0A7G5DHI5_9PSED|nr:hypothetical protein [Pseudomonas berkeleyensis]QMV61210.1 hypothetical protein HS968_14240 [Pseudomonas berkeleyensis]WSO36636.1 hypothetical protein VUJ49_14295 [Pseudomonas berkeleyensis]
MINGRLLKQYDFPVALGITHLTTAAFLLNSSASLPSWVSSYSYFSALTCLLLSLVLKPLQGFLTGIAVSFAATVIIRAINMSLVSLHGAGVDYLLGLMGAVIGLIAILIYSKVKLSQTFENGFALGCTGALGGYLLSMFLSCNTVLYCGPAFSWGA